VVTAGSWWRRSRWALLGLVVLVPAAGAASLSVDAFDYWAGQPHALEVVERGDAAQLGEARLRVTDSWVAVGGSADGIELDVPEGTALVSVTLELDASAADEDFSCRMTLLEPARDREWRDGYTGTDYFPREGFPDDIPYGCSWAEVPFPIELTFLVPEDAVDGLELEVIDPELLPSAFRLRLA